MATKLPRLAITLPAATSTALAKLSRLQRRPRSAIAADLLVEMTPTLERIAKLLEAAIVNRAKLPAETAHRMQALEELLGSVATFGLDRLEAATKPAGRPRAARSRRPAH